MKKFSLLKKIYYICGNKIKEIMSTIPRRHFLDVKKILDGSPFKKSSIAGMLFPDVKFPLRAFARILTGEAELSASQVSLLAEILNCQIADLYEPDRWVWNDTKDGKHVFIYGNSYKVEVDLETWESLIYYNGEIIDRGVFCNGETPIGEFFNEMKNRIQDWLELA